MTKRSKVVLLLLAHVVVLIGLYTYRYPIKDSFEKRDEWGAGEFQGAATDYVKLYFSNVVEAYYYEWSTIALGKKFFDDYPFSEHRRSQLKQYLVEDPELQWPYRDIAFEYPPLLAVPLLAARALSWDFLSFMRVFAAFICIAYLACLALAYGIWKQVSAPDKLEWTKLLLLSVCSILALGQIFVSRLDVFPAFFYLLTLWTFIKARYVSSSLAMVLGVFTKAYAILLAPLFGIVLLYQKKYREFFVAVFLVTGLVLGVNLALAGLTDGAFWDSYRYHSERGIQIESLYALVPYVAHLVSGVPVQIYEAYGSMNIRMAGDGYLQTLSRIIPVLLMLILYGSYALRVKRYGQRAMSVRQIALTATMLVLAFIVSFKVFSPQFFIWLIPIIFIIKPRHEKIVFGLFLVLLVLTHLIWPNFYFLLEKGHPVGTVLLLARNVGFIILMGLLWRDWVRVR